MSNSNNTKNILQKYIKRKRADLSTFLIHLTREYKEISPYRNLMSILNDKKIEARKPYGFFQYDEIPQRVVCFTEAPLDQIKAFVGEIPGRRIRLSKYGLVFTQKFIIEKDGNPCFYINTYKKPSKYLNALKGLDFILNLAKNINIRTEAKKLDLGLAKKNFDILKPFFNKFGRDIDFYWEREWRIPDNINFRHEDIVVGLCPEQVVNDFEEKFKKVKFIDPEWSLEEIITKLVG